MAEIADDKNVAWEMITERMEAEDYKYDDGGDAEDKPDSITSLRSTITDNGKTHRLRFYCDAGRIAIMGLWDSTNPESIVKLAKSSGLLIDSQLFEFNQDHPITWPLPNNAIALMTAFIVPAPVEKRLLEAKEIGIYFADKNNNILAKFAIEHSKDSRSMMSLLFFSCHKSV